MSIVAGVWLSAQQGPQPAFGQLIASPVNFIPSTSTAVPNIVVNTPASVTFTIRIDTPTVNPTSVELQRVEPAGKLLSSSGRLFDDGTHGDSVGGDKIFTAVIVLNEAMVGRIYFRVGAAFRGNTQNAWSSATGIDVDPFNIPPDPGDAGKQTLEGIDSDVDGVRDDVQRYIAVSFPTDVATRSALYAFARGEEAFIVGASNKSAAMAADGNIELSTECIVSLRPNDGFDIIDDMTDHFLNTPSRIAADNEADRQLTGITFTPPPIARWSRACGVLR